MLSTTVDPVRPVSLNLPDASVMYSRGGVPATPTSTPARGAGCLARRLCRPRCRLRAHRRWTVSSTAGAPADAVRREIFEPSSRVAIMCKPHDQGRLFDRESTRGETELTGNGGCGITLSSRCDACDAERYTRCVALRKVARLRLVDVHELVRVPVDEREPGALHLHHDAVAPSGTCVLVRGVPLERRSADWAPSAPASLGLRRYLPRITSRQRGIW
jgi:hypothetical protein